MTAREIADRLLSSSKGVTPARLQKARRLAQQQHVEWAAVELLLGKWAENPSRTFEMERPPAT